MNLQRIPIVPGLIVAQVVILCLAEPAAGAEKIELSGKDIRHQNTTLTLDANSALQDEGGQWVLRADDLLSLATLKADAPAWGGRLWPERSNHKGVWEQKLESQFSSTMPVSVTHAASNTMYVSYRCPGTNDAWVLWTMMKSGASFWEITGLRVQDNIYWVPLRPDNTSVGGTWIYLGASPTLWPKCGGGMYSVNTNAASVTNTFVVSATASMWLSLGMATNSGRVTVTLNGAAALLNQLSKDTNGSAYIDTTGTGSMSTLCATGLPAGSYTLVIAKDTATNGDSTPRVYVDAVGLQHSGMPPVGSWSASHVMVHPAYLKHFNGSTYTTKTSTFADPSGLAVGGMTNGHYIYLAADNTSGASLAQNIQCVMATNNAASSTLTLEYYNGSGWCELSFVDETSGLSKDGWIAFSLPENAATVTVDSRSAAWLRLGIAAGANATTDTTRLARIMLGRRYSQTVVRYGYTSGSHWEYAYYYGRPGGSTTNVGGFVHGGEALVSYAILVDGDAVSLPLGGTATGSRVALLQSTVTTRTSPADAWGSLHHIWDGAGCTVSWRHTFANEVVIAPNVGEYCYTGMMPVIYSYSSTPHMLHFKARGAKSVDGEDMDNLTWYCAASSGELAAWDDTGFSMLLSQRDSDVANLGRQYVAQNTAYYFVDSTTDFAKGYITLAEGGDSVHVPPGGSIGAVNRYLIGWSSDPGSTYAD